MEYVVVGTLIGAGWLWQRQNKNPFDGNIPRGDMRLHQTPYESNQFSRAQEITQERANQHVPRTRKAIESARRLKSTEEMVQTLSGESIPKSQFKHKNMKPFFGSKMTQNMNMNQNKTLLETFTGTAPLPEKKEVKSFFDPMPQQPHGSTILQDLEQQKGRFQPSQNKQNILPFEQKQVSSAGSYSDYERTMLRPKTIEELRGALNPKNVYGGRIIAGKSTVDDRTLQPEMFKRKVSNEVQNKYILKTTGAFKKTQQHPEIILRNTDRKDNPKSYVGNAAPPTEKMGTIHSQVSDPHKKQLRSTGILNAVASGQWKEGGGLGDYGRNSIRPAEMNVTEKKGTLSNVVTAVKALVAPFQSEIMPTIREEYEKNTHTGNLTGPTKLTHYDPKDAMRTTLRQQTSDSSYTGVAGSKNPRHTANDMANASFNELKEYLETNRAPTQTGVKLMAGQETVNSTRDRQSYHEPPNAGITKIRGIVPTKSNTQHLAKRNEYGNQLRLDSSVMDALQDNPYATSIQDVFKR